MAIRLHDAIHFFFFQICHDFASTGDYEIKVRLSNAFTNLEERLQVKVQHPVLDLHLSALSSVLGEETSLYVSVHGSYQSSLGLEIDWNDGVKSVLDGDDLEVWVSFHNILSDNCKKLRKPKRCSLRLKKDQLDVWTLLKPLSLQTQTKTLEQ